MNGAETTAMMNSIQQGLGRPIRKKKSNLFMDHASIWPKDSSSHLCSFITVVGSSSSNDGRTFQNLICFYHQQRLFSTKINEDLQSEHIRQRMAQAAELTEAELAELIYDYFDKSLQLTPYTQLANLTGQPAISLPTCYGNGVTLRHSIAGCSWT